MGLIALGTAEERVSDCKDRPAEDIQTERRNGQKKTICRTGGREHGPERGSVAKAPRTRNWSLGEESANGTDVSFTAIITEFSKTD